MDQLEIKNAQGERLETSFHTGDGEKPLVILGHGLTGNKDRELLVAVATQLAAKGWPCLRFSFAGNGGSEGKFTEATISKEVEDLRAVVDKVAPEGHFAYIGHSMGAAVGAKFAAQESRILSVVSLAGMVHTADFYEREFGELTPDDDVMWELEDCPLSSIYQRDLQQIGSVLPEITKVSVPWLFFHGAEDDVIPLSDSEEACAAVQGRRELVNFPDEGHVFSEKSYGLIAEKIDEWLKACL